jgi:hypothetical protein
MLKATRAGMASEDDSIGSDFPDVDLPGAVSKGTASFAFYLLVA